MLPLSIYKEACCRASVRFHLTTTSISVWLEMELDGFVQACYWCWRKLYNWMLTQWHIIGYWCLVDGWSWGKFWQFNCQLHCAGWFSMCVLDPEGSTFCWLVLALVCCWFPGHCLVVYCELAWDQLCLVLSSILQVSWTSVVWCLVVYCDLKCLVYWTSSVWCSVVYCELAGLHLIGV